MAHIPSMLAMGAILASISAHADYSFIVSGYPVANPSYPAQSPATSLEGSMRAARTAPAALEARFRSSAESPAAALRSDKWQGFTIVVR